VGVGALCVDREPISAAVDVGGASVAAAFEAVAADAGHPDRGSA
jgi:hypothetical protein